MQGETPAAAAILAYAGGMLKRLVVLPISASFAIAAPAPGIFGRAVNSQTHEAVRRADIKVYTSRDQFDTVTDGDGRFSFPALTPGDYNLVAHRDGYTDNAYRVERSDFADQKELPVELRPQGVITGRVLDGSGRPLQSASIQALGPGNHAALTNDLGEYRMSGVNPGRYELRATYRAGGESEFDVTPLTMATALYGGSEKPAPVTVQAGTATGGIDFTLNPVEPATLRGTLRTDTGVVRERTTLWIMGTTGEGGHNATSQDDGTFEIPDVGPGTYTVSAQTLNKSAPMFGMSRVEVRGDDVDSIGILLKPVPVLTGEIQMQDGVAAGLAAGTVYFNRVDRVTSLGMEIVHVEPGRPFSTHLIPGDYTLAFDGPILKATIRRVTLNGVQIDGWNVHVDDSATAKNMVIELGPK